jgi:hypothetical protein
MERLDFAFIDGHHAAEPTLDYFDQCLAKAHNDTVFIFDDIHWSTGMEEAWVAIKAHPKVTVTIDLFHFGIVFLRKAAGGLRAEVLNMVIGAWWLVIGYQQSDSAVQLITAHRSQKATFIVKIHPHQRHQPTSLLGGKRVPRTACGSRPAAPSTAEQPHRHARDLLDSHNAKHHGHPSATVRYQVHLGRRDRPPWKLQGALTAETDIRRWKTMDADADLPTMRNLFRRSPAISQAHICRTVCRRAERSHRLALMKRCPPSPSAIWTVSATCCSCSPAGRSPAERTGNAMEARG